MCCKSPVSLPLHFSQASPYLGQHGLGQAGQHEDLYDLRTGDKAVHVCVRFEEKVVVAPPVCQWDHPVHGGGLRTQTTQGV